MARAASLHDRYGVSECRRAGVYSRISSVGMVSSWWSRASSATSRRRSSWANSGRGASGTTGSRSASNGSGIAAPFLVGDAEPLPRAYQQRLRRVHGAAEQPRDLWHREAVEVAQRERGPVMRAERLEHRVCVHAVEAQVGVLVAVAGWGELQAAFLACVPPPVVDELVAGDGDEPRHAELGHGLVAHGAHRGEERLAGEILGGRVVADARPQVAVDLGEGPVVERQ